MATTILPKMGKLNKKVSSKKLLREVHSRFESSYGDFDHSSSVEDASYYAGLVDAFGEVEWLLTAKNTHVEKMFSKSDWLLMGLAAFSFIQFQIYINKLGEQAPVAKQNEDGSFDVTSNNED